MAMPNTHLTKEQEMNWKIWAEKKGLSWWAVRLMLLLEKNKIELILNRSGTSLDEGIKENLARFIQDNGP